MWGFHFYIFSPTLIIVYLSLLAIWYVHPFVELKHCSTWFLIFNSLISKDVEEIFLYLSAICIFSLDKCLNHLPIFKLCCLLTVELYFFLDSGYTVFIRYMTYLCSPHSVGYLLLPNSVLFPFFFFFWCVVILHSLWDLSSLKRDWTWAHSRDSTKS